MALTLFPPRAPSRQSSQTELAHTKPIEKDSPDSPTYIIQNNNLPLPFSYHSRNNSRSNSPVRMHASSLGRPYSPSNQPQQGKRSPTPLQEVDEYRPFIPPTTLVDRSPLARPASPREDTVSTSPRSESPNWKPNHPSKVSYLAGAKLKAKEAWMRRKGSLSDLDTMTTVQEICMDSPTIPGRPPMHDRQASSPAALLLPTKFGAVPTKKSTSEARLRSDSSFQARVGNAQNKMQSLSLRPSSPPSTAPPPPPSTSTSTVTAPPITTLTPSASPIEQDTPPAVPPKEFNRPAPLKITKVTTRPRADSAPNTDRAKLVKDQWSHRKQQASASRLQEIRQEKTEPMSSCNSQSPPACTESKPLKPKRKSTTYRTIPSGLRPGDARKKLEPLIIDSLQNAARKTSEKFGVLSPKDVDNLTQELAQLETRCTYLRDTHVSLRAGRRALHSKMLQHLRSDRSGSFSRDTLLKQQEALSDLDTSIDDWESKMERAEARRAQVHRKLLEHVAAALSVVTPTENQRPKEPVMVTPPRTPEYQTCVLKKDRQQSIIVYALFADVEQEIGRMMNKDTPNTSSAR